MAKSNRKFFGALWVVLGLLIIFRPELIAWLIGGYLVVTGLMQLLEH
jgi:hypothetical protein